MLDLKRLRLLRELHARGTIAATAEALSYSAPAVSQQLAKLEAEAGATLLERVGRGVRLTDAGLILLEHAEALLTRVEQAEADLAAASRQVRGSLHVSSFQTGTISLLAPVLHRLTRRYPALRVHVSEIEPDAAVRALTLGEIDLVLGDEYDRGLAPRYPGVDWEVLATDPLRVVLPADHPRAGTGPLALSALADSPWAVGLAGSAYTDTVFAACAELGGFQPDARHHTTDLLMILALVRAGQAVALLPDLLGADGDLALSVRPVRGGSVERTIYTAVRAGSVHRPGVVELRAALRREARSASTVLDQLAR
ncbi:LysR family transcriptional regulator [Amycolatopsis suaedae]|uniref:LysR family transcriptional regulator n=1 Tax=Amycolatopsis suaedae TaxID=2510978 RepID=A0A4Q7J708_9PSEU|nr:LysR substrate-binding domain-containing protein [Amycolatopsis suaedae]RZQ63440.1 LysR family transcriptional regulator [Amycolatopsis suaedae]